MLSSYNSPTSQVYQKLEGISDVVLRISRAVIGSGRTDYICITSIEEHSHYRKIYIKREQIKSDNSTISFYLMQLYIPL